MTATQTAKPGQKQKKKRTLAQRVQSLEQQLEKVEAAYEQYRSLTDQKLKALAETVGSVWKNQVELSKSEDRLDEQFCVLTRLSITRLNDLTIRAEGDDLITYEAVNKMFMDWAAFRARSDFRDHMQTWMMGGDLSALPEPPKQEEPSTPEAPATDGEEPQEFGGDYGSERETSSDGDPSVEQGGPEAGANVAPDSVPTGQDDDAAAREAPTLP